MIGGVVSEAGAQKSFIEFLTEDLLNTGFENELSIENEIYLVENILPSVVHAMQSLIVEVQRKNILKNDIEMNTIDVDMPTLKEPRFDPINWIAQFLYRKNPKYNPNVCKTEYEKQLCIISDMLKSRRATIVEAKEERLKLEKQRRAWEREKKRLQKEKEEHEYKENVKKSWESVIKELTKGLCRAGNPFVTKNELSAVIKNIPVIEGVSDDSFQKQVLEAFKEFDKINEEVLINKLNDISLSLSIAPATFEAIKEQVKATTVEIVKDFEKELEEQIFFPVIYAVPVDNHGETNGLSPGLVSLEVPVYDSVQSFKTRLREAVLSNLSGTFTKTDEQKDDTNQVDAEHEMEKFIKEFCDTEDPLFYSKQQGLVKSDSDMKEGGLLMEMEFKAFMKHVAGMESKETSKRLMRRISICLGTDKEQSMKLIEEIRTNLKRKPSETDEALKFRLEQERLAKEEAIIKRYADQEKRSNQLSEILRGIMDLVMTGAVKSNMSSTLRLLFKNLDRLLPKVTMTDEMKEVLQNVDIVDSPVELSELPLYLENLAWKISDLSVEIEDDDFNACLHDIQLYVAETTKFFRDAQEKVRNRREMENKCINEVAQLAKRVDISLPKLCEQTVLTLEKFFRSYYSSFSVYISILERPSSDTQQYQFLQRLRYIACSSKDKPILLNRYLYPGEGISFSILESGDPAFVPNVRDPSSQVKVFGLGGDDKHRVDGEFSRRGSYYGVPLISRNEPIGILGMDNIDLYENKSSVETFKEDDLKVALAVSKKLSECLEKIDRRSKLINLGSNAMKWIGHMLDIGIEYYIVEKDYSYEYGQKREIIKMYHVHQDEESSTVLDPVNSESYEKLYLWQCVESKARVTDKKANGKSAIAIPIMTKNEVVAILSIRNNAVVPDSKEIIPSEQMKDFEDTLSVFNIAVDSIRRENFGQIVQANLAGEKIDDESRVGMLFPSLMLTQIRDSISNIDQSGMAEIKSYRKPPAVIHKVMKCVLYIFGKKKSQVAKWTDMIKYLNMDMLKQIVEYDPTAVQKKKRFVRVEKVLKTIPRGDIRKQGSKPTKDLFDWLIVSLELRKAAVAARKRHLETAGKSADVKLEDGPEEEGSSEESGDDEPEETQGVEKSE